MDRTKIEHIDESRKKANAAYRRGMGVIKEAWQQGARNEPLSGDAKLFSDMHASAWEKNGRGITGVVGYYPNVILENYQRGVDGLPYLLTQDRYSGS